MVRRKKHLSLWIALIAFLLLTALFFTTAISAANEIPRVTEYSRSRLSSGVPFSTYEKLPEAYREELAVCAELNTEIVGEIGELKPVLVNEAYFDVYGIHIGGSAVTKEHIRKHIHTVIISDQIALRMSLDGNVIGQTVPLFGQDFTVVGIYKKPDGFLHEISSDIYDRVYIPYTCYDNYAEISIDALAAPKGSYSEKALPMLGLTETDPNFYLENDLGTKHDMIAAFPNLLIFTFTLILSVMIIRILSRIIKQSYHKLHEDYQNNNLSVVLRHNWLYILSRFTIFAFLIAIPITLILILPPKFIIPESFIPDDNIFDITHYLEEFKYTLQLFNTNPSNSYSYLNHFFIHSISLLIPCGIIVIALFLLIMCSVSAMLRHGFYNKK